MAGGRLEIGGGNYRVGEVALDEMERARQNAMRQAQLRASLLAQQQDYSLNQQKLALSQRSARDDQRARMMQLGLQSRQQGIDNDFRASESVFNRGFKEKAFGADRDDALFGRGERERDYGLREKDSIGRAEDRDADRQARIDAAKDRERQAQMSLVSREETGALAPLYRDLEDAKQAGDFNTAQKIQRDIEMIKGQYTERIRGTMGLPPSSANPAAAPSEPVSQQQRTPEEYAEMARVMGIMANPAMRNSLEATGGGGGGSAGVGESIPNESNAARIARFRAEKEAAAKAATLAEQQRVRDNVITERDRVRKEGQTDARRKSMFGNAAETADQDYQEAKKRGLTNEATALRMYKLGLEQAYNSDATGLPPEPDEVAAARSSLRSILAGDVEKQNANKDFDRELGNKTKAEGFAKIYGEDVRNMSATDAQKFVDAKGLSGADADAVLNRNPTYSAIQKIKTDAAIAANPLKDAQQSLANLQNPEAQKLNKGVNIPEAVAAAQRLVAELSSPNAELNRLARDRKNRAELEASVSRGGDSLKRIAAMESEPGRGNEMVRPLLTRGDGPGRGMGSTNRSFWQGDEYERRRKALYEQEKKRSMMARLFGNW